MSGSKPRNDLGNGVRPRAALGVKDPTWRLGALVSLPESIEKVMRVQKPDRSLSLKADLPSCDPQGKRFQRIAIWAPKPPRHHSRWEAEQPPPINQGAFVPMRLKPNLNVNVFENCRLSCFGTRRLEKPVRCGHIRNDTDEPEGTNHGLWPVGLLGSNSGGVGAHRPTNQE
jgi:hypothetical protein